MDLATAMNHKRSIKKELDAFRPKAPKPSYALKIMDKEIERLNEELVRGFLRSFADSSEVKISVNKESMELLLSNHFGTMMEDSPSLQGFCSKLASELSLIRKLPEKFPLIYNFIIRVTEILEDEVYRRHPTCGSLQLAHSRLYHERLDKAIKEAIKKAIKENNEGARSEQVLNILRLRDIEIDRYVRCTTRERFFEATYPPSRRESFWCFRFLEMIIPSHWRFLNLGPIDV